jgi:hypothetical protein
MFDEFKKVNSDAYKNLKMNNNVMVHSNKDNVLFYFGDTKRFLITSAHLLNLKDVKTVKRFYIGYKVLYNSEWCYFYKLELAEEWIAVFERLVDPKG